MSKKLSPLSIQKVYLYNIDVILAGLTKDSKFFVNNEIP